MDLNLLLPLPIPIYLHVYQALQSEIFPMATLMVMSVSNGFKECACNILQWQGYTLYIQRNKQLSIV